MNTLVETISPSHYIGRFWMWLTHHSATAWLEWTFMVTLFTVLFLFVFAIANAVRANDQLFSKKANKALIRLDVRAAHVTDVASVTVEVDDFKPDEIDAIVEMFNNTHPDLSAHVIGTAIMVETRAAATTTQ